MTKRLLYILLVAGLLAVAALAAFTIPASAEPRTITVRLADGTIVTVTVDVPPGTPLSEIEVPGVIVNEPAAPRADSAGARPGAAARARSARPAAASRRRRATDKRKPRRRAQGRRQLDPQPAG